MTNPMRDAGLSGVTLLLLTYCTYCVVGCTSLEDLSSYSAGASDAGSPVVVQSPTAAAAPATRPSDAGTAPSAAESQSPEGVALIPAASVAAADDCAGDGEFSGLDTGACYLVADTASSWRDARDLCEAWGGDLAVIGSPDENDFLGSRCDNDVWLGANDFGEEGIFRWLDGDPVDPEGPWASTQPDNFEDRENCLELRASGDEWNDASCMTNKRALCERLAAGQDAK